MPSLSSTTSLVMLALPSVLGAPVYPIYVELAGRGLQTIDAAMDGQFGMTGRSPGFGAPVFNMTTPGGQGFGDKYLAPLGWTVKEDRSCEFDELQKEVHDFFDYNTAVYASKKVTTRARLRDSKLGTHGPLHTPKGDQK